MPGKFSPAQIEDLPPPVRRYFAFVLRDGQPVIARARLRWSGGFQSRPGAGWAPFTALQHFTTRPPGFTTRRIFYAWSVQLHRGTRGNDGPVLFDFRWPGWDNRWSDCASGLSSDLLRELVDDPRSFYVDVHTCEHWFGAIRGQLAHSR